jgi:hypothetical protein
MYCQQPPWGQLSAIDVNTGEFAWRVTLGVTDSLPPDKQNTGRPGNGGSIATAGGLVFIGATDDARFRAFDAKTGKELWTFKLGGAANATPSTYRGKDGRQYVVTVSTGGGYFEAPLTDDSIMAFRASSQELMTSGQSSPSGYLPIRSDMRASRRAFAAAAAIVVFPERRSDPLSASGIAEPGYAQLRGHRNLPEDRQDGAAARHPRWSHAAARAHARRRSAAARCSDPDRRHSKALVFDSSRDRAQFPRHLEIQRRRLRARKDAPAEHGAPYVERRIGGGRHRCRGG